MFALVAAAPAHAQFEWPPKRFFETGREAASSKVRPHKLRRSRSSGAHRPRRRSGTITSPVKAKYSRWQWSVRQTTWSAADERAFGAFIKAIGESDCTTVDQCLKSPESNPKYYRNHPPGMSFAADCADFPYLLRAYFAWQNDLPFSYSAAFGAHARPNGYATPRWGNRIMARRSASADRRDIRRVLPAIGWAVSSEHFRVPVSYKGDLLPDHYPVQVSRASIRPGTLIFDPGGHVALVYGVTDDGHVRYFDAQPDSTVTRGIYGRHYPRSEPTMGAGFKRWRPQRLVGAAAGADGVLRGGRIVLAKDAELADWSDEQFYGNRPRAKAKHWRAATFRFDGEKVDFHHFVRLRMATPGFRFQPVEELRTMLRQICRKIEYRVAAVARAIAAGMHLKAQPARLPRNIYVTQGDWERYATPARDANLKRAFQTVRDETIRMVRMHDNGNKLIAFDGKNLEAALMAAYTRETAKCAIAYTRSNGEKQKLSFRDVHRRLFKLSFDPHHCVERRWGATRAEELATCPDGIEKSLWYEAQQPLRNRLQREFTGPMDLTLSDLTQAGGVAIGRARPPSTELVKYLR